VTLLQETESPAEQASTLPLDSYCLSNRLPTALRLTLTTLVETVSLGNSLHTIIKYYYNSNSNHFKP
jgi:hypothetical protein